MTDPKSENAPGIRLEYISTFPARLARSLAIPYPLLLTAAVLACFGLGLELLTRFPLREDEAIYGYWALHFLHEDPWFLTVWPDKPPIFIWLLAGAFSLFGPGEASARWVNVAATALLVPVTASLARAWITRSAASWTDSQTAKAAGIIAGAAVALNPYTLSFAATAYTDPVMVLCGTAGLACAARGRGFWAGFWLAAAAMTKQQGTLYVPLALALLATLGAAWNWRALTRMLAGALVVVAPIVAWDAMRWAVAPSPWAWSARTYGMLEIAPPQEWLPRAWEWSSLAWHFAGSSAAWVWVGLLALVVLTKGFSRRDAETQGEKQALLLIAWCAAFMAAHVLVTVQVWDRYLLPLASLFALGIGICGARIFARDRRLFAALMLAGVLVMTPPALKAAAGGYAIGGDHGAYSGLRETLAALGAQPPLREGERAVLYHHALGWHYRFYLYEQVRPKRIQGRIDLRWFPTAAYLADNAAKTPYPRAYLIRPEWLSLRDLELHLAQRGLQPRALAQAGNFTLLEIAHRPQAACAWCVCAVEGTAGVGSEKWGVGKNPTAGAPSGPLLPTPAACR